MKACTAIAQFIATLLLAALFTACTRNPETVAQNLPTLASLPSATATLPEPTVTPTTAPTNTATPDTRLITLEVELNNTQIALGATQTALVPTATDTATFTLTPSSTNTATLTLTPSTTFTPRPTLTITETRTPGPTNTPAPTFTLRPTDPPAVGTRNNPVSNGNGYRFYGIGALYSQGEWSPGQTGLAIVHLTFTCERPSDQSCDTSTFMLDVVGSSGSVYQRVFESGVPDPGFGSFMNPQVFGGGTSSGYAGFLITSPENRLTLRVRIFLMDGEVFFDI